MHETPSRVLSTKFPFPFLYTFLQQKLGRAKQNKLSSCSFEGFSLQKFRPSKQVFRFLYTKPVIGVMMKTDWGLHMKSLWLKKRGREG